jgi:hypothetical protein
MNQAIRMKCFLMIFLALFLIVAGSTSSYAIDKAHYIELFKKVTTLAKQKNWQGARDVLTEIGRELPAPTPRYLLIVASIEARMGHKEEALKWVQKYVATGLSYDFMKDDDLKEILSGAEGQKSLAQMKQQDEPVERTEFVCSLPQADTMPEDIAYIKESQSGGSFFVSSIQHHTLYRVTLPKAGSKECIMQEVPLPDDVKRWPTLAVSADPKRKVLWMTADAMPGFSGFPKEDSGKAVLFEVDANNGNLLHRYTPETSGPAVLGDMQVTSDGTVYVTDSIGGGVYRLRGNPDTARLEKIADGLFSPQTPALSRDGKRLFVADYSMGIAVIDLSAGPGAKVNYLPHPENVAVVALDGLYLSGDSLIGIQNGTEPVRILRLNLNHAQTEIVSAEVIEQNTERMGDPTHAVAVDGWFYVSANVGWSKVDDDTGKVRDGEKFTPPVLLRFPAPAGKQ